MKYLSFLLVAGVTLLFQTPAQAQHTEYRIAAGAGLFHYVTNDKEKQYYSMINIAGSHDNPDNYANNPYGNRNGPAFQFSVELKRVTRQSFLWGINLGFEMTESRKKINWTFIPPNHFQKAKGHLSLKSKFIAANPYIGYRLSLNKFYLDLTGGVDIAIGLSPVHEQGEAVIRSNNTVAKVDRKSDGSGYDPFELRGRLQAELGYQRWGLYLGYSRGFYKGHLASMGGEPKYSFSRYLGAGIFYRLK